MNNLYKEGTKCTPEIDFNADTGTLNISGASYPENTSNFFGDVIQWLEDYFKYTDKKITVNFRFKYFNTSTSIAILDIMDMLEEKCKEGCEVLINWFYREDNDVIKESGEEFAEDISVPFKIISYSK